MMPGKRLPYTPLPVDEWPEKDLLAWRKAISGRRRRRGPAARWSESTRGMTQRGYGLWLTWLSSHGLLDVSAEPLERITDARIDAFLDEVGQYRRGAGLAIDFEGIYHFVRITGGLDAFPWLRDVKRGLSALPPLPKSYKDVVDIDALFELGLGLMARAEGADDFSRRDHCTMYRDGLMIALLAMRPTMRRRNFTALELGSTIVRRENGYRISFPASWTKQRRPIAFSVPDQLTRHLDLYVDVVRPALLARGTAGDQGDLWISRLGNAMSDLVVSHRVAGVTERHLGVRVPPHRFRDCAATHVATHAPNDIGIVKNVLGHSTHRTSERHYNVASSVSAAARLQEVVLRQRRVKLEVGDP